MKKMLMASVLVFSSIFASIALAETPVVVKSAAFMDVKEVISDTSTVSPSLVSGVNYNRCQDESRTMVFRDSSGVLKSVTYHVSNQVACSDGDGGTSWGS